MRVIHSKVIREKPTSKRPRIQSRIIRHEIMVLFVLHKLILQTRMHSHPVRLDVWFSVWPVVYFHISCVPTAEALVRLRSPEPSLIASVIRSWPLVFLSNIQIIFEEISSSDSVKVNYCSLQTYWWCYDDTDADSRKPVCIFWTSNLALNAIFLPNYKKKRNARKMRFSFQVFLPQSTLEPAPDHIGDQQRLRRACAYLLWKSGIKK